LTGAGLWEGELTPTVEVPIALPEEAEIGITARFGLLIVPDFVVTRK
jgi:hypothetical protein